MIFVDDKIIDISVPRAMTPNNISKYSGLPVSVIRKLIKLNKVDYMRSGNVYYVSVASIDRIIESGITL